MRLMKGLIITDNKINNPFCVCGGIFRDAGRGGILLARALSPAIGSHLKPGVCGAEERAWR